MILLEKTIFFIYNTVKTTHAVTCIKRSHFFCPSQKISLELNLFLRDLLSWKTSFSFQRWPLYTGLTTFHLDNFIFLAKIFFKGILSKEENKLLEYKDVKTVLAFQICNGKTLENFWCLVCIIYPPSFWHWFV
jgi:hypothetical protein